MVADLLERNWTLIDMSLIGLPEDGVERLIAAYTGRTDSNDEHSQPFHSLESLHAGSFVENERSICKVGSDTSKMRPIIRA